VFKRFFSFAQCLGYVQHLNSAQPVFELESVTDAKEQFDKF